MAMGRLNSTIDLKKNAFQQLAHLGGCILFGYYMGGSPELLHSKHNHQFGPFLKGLQLKQRIAIDELVAIQRVLRV